MVADVDALQNLHLRAVGPPLVALTAGAVAIGVTAAVLPWAALVLAAGLLAGGLVVPAVAGSLARQTGSRQAEARGKLASELVEVLNASPELAVYGREGDSLDRIGAADDELVRLARRDAFAGGVGDGLALLVVGVTVAGVLACAVSAHAAGGLDRTLIAMLALLALASFEAVQPLSAAARDLFATLSAGRRILEVMDRAPAVTDPCRSRAPAGRRRSGSRSRTCAPGMRRASALFSMDSASSSIRDGGSRSSARAARVRRLL